MAQVAIIISAVAMVITIAQVLTLLISERMATIELINATMFRTIATKPINMQIGSKNIASKPDASPELINWYVDKR